jgi:hypothetical protein
MLRATIHANPDTDVDAETANLRQYAEKAGIEAVLIEHIVDETQTVVRDFVNRGRELKALGSQLKAERAIRGDGYEIRVSFETVPRSGVVGRVLALFGR